MSVWSEVTTWFWYTLRSDKKIKPLELKKADLIIGDKAANYQLHYSPNAYNIQ